MPKATVIEVYRGRAMIMTEQCEFKEIRTQRPLQAGEEIEYTSADLYTTPRRAQLGVLAACFAIVCLFACISIQHLFLNRVEARIAFELNPGLEVSINKEYKVVEAKAFNQDGSTIIDAAQPVGNDLEGALSKIMDQCKRYGYLKESGNVIGVSFSQTEKIDPQLQVRVQRCLKQALIADRSEGVVYMFTVDGATWKQAIKQGVSPLRYFLWKKAQERGISLKMQQVNLRDPSIQKIAKESASRAFSYQREVKPKKESKQGSGAPVGNTITKPAAESRVHFQERKHAAPESKASQSGPTTEPGKGSGAGPALPSKQPDRNGIALPTGNGSQDNTLGPTVPTSGDQAGNGLHNELRGGSPSGTGGGAAVENGSGSMEASQGISTGGNGESSGSSSGGPSGGR